MRENPFDSVPPPDEVWWERELHRNEKLMDKYLAVMDENPDWVNWKHPEDLYNKVHFGIDPPSCDEEGNPESDELPEEDASAQLNPDPHPAANPVSADDESDLSPEDAAMIQAMNSACEPEEGIDSVVNEPLNHEDYPKIARQARDFALRVIRLGNELPAEMEVLLLSAGKVSSNLAGGHGLGYAEHSICGNIVKCRWALADCDFCREMLGHFSERTREPALMELCREAGELGEAIKQRIARLRARVWW